ncbi:MAG: helix-turn-helix transcriptional regulator [Clostridia bacterium]|nr:helix-turn-helix transcriptional regulator [Clostridia bacterium]
MNVGEAVRLRIIDLCEERQITINKLAMLCGITQSTISNIISGRNNSTTIATIKKICDGLDLSLVDFFSSDLFKNLEQEIQ